MGKTSPVCYLCILLETMKETFQKFDAGDMDKGHLVLGFSVFCSTRFRSRERELCIS